ncbi:MAG: hypothetical protein K6T65_01535 [Peptococcaceae bacterium]|nr:hypothetical protein [Peptococcaceae bacterium]
MQEKQRVYYRDLETGKKRFTTGVVQVKKQPWLGGVPIKVVYVIRRASETIIPEWCLAPESRHLLKD